MLSVELQIFKGEPFAHQITILMLLCHISEIHVHRSGHKRAIPFLNIGHVYISNVHIHV